MTREEAIARIREQFLGVTDDENSMCKVASERGMFCHGFDRWNERELRDRYWWIVRKKPDITREELERLANLWQLAQQDVRHVPLCCDVQSQVHDTCRGWDDFTTEELIATADALPSST